MKGEKLKLLKNLPSLDEVKRGIEELVLIEKWDNYQISKNPKEFNKRLHELFVKKVGIFPITSTSVDTTTFPFTFYRLRRFDDSMNPALISEYSYPPNHLINSYQRANIPGNPVLYCSNDASTTIFEVLKNSCPINPENTFFLSEWKFIENIKVRITPYLFGNLAQNSPYKLWTDSSYRQIEQLLKKDFNSDQINGFKKVLEYLSNLFVYENTYTASSFIAHQHLYADFSLRTDLFVYPSIQTDQYSINFAIHPNVVIEKMRLNRVIKFNILNFIDFEHP
ncbi:RES family NAD+ phosphorylase [Aquiflexum sp.]|uniref:RES family NAD+ phosphorylase n=1 Tax=Aquiflexum sp. TaxID=1872584 RepID=UPI003593A0D1